ncbi:hypothetical protein [Nitrosopumilus sp. Nsub]|uniref:hypothetical protein n=1 Tax=Nitrosopumilus sp. Nsub TaxID=1776294 RepID=UPI000835FCBD|nr:hypothetical protein [Nitrosopumilus sp. Nsub]
MANILIALVIAMFVGTAVFVGYNYSQSYSDDAGGHSIPIDLHIVETTPELLQIIEKQDGFQTII